MQFTGLVRHMSSIITYATVSAVLPSFHLSDVVVNVLRIGAVVQCPSSLGIFQTSFRVQVTDGTEVLRKPVAQDSTPSNLSSPDHLDLPSDPPAAILSQPSSQHVKPSPSTRYCILRTRPPVLKPPAWLAQSQFHFFASGKIPIDPTEQYRRQHHSQRHLSPKHASPSNKMREISPLPARNVPLP
jgi:hypothetical protein